MWSQRKNKTWKKSAVIVVGWQQQPPAASCLQPHHTHGDIQYNSIPYHVMLLNNDIAAH